MNTVDTRLLNLRPWKPGQSGNPIGRPMGSRNKLEERFLEELLTSWEAQGPAALQEARLKDPVAYVRMVASLMPRKADPEPSLADITRDQLRVAIGQRDEEAGVLGIVLDRHVASC